MLYFFLVVFDALAMAVFITVRPVAFTAALLTVTTFTTFFITFAGAGMPERARPV